MNSIFDLLKSVYRNNRKLVNVLGIIILVLAIALVVVSRITTRPIEESSSLGTVSEAGASGENLDGQLSSLHDIIKNTYGEELDGYEIARGELLDADGNTWYVTTFSQPTDQWSLPGDVYRLILRKTTDSWEIVAGPELTFSYLEYPDIPKPIIFSANNL